MLLSLCLGTRPRKWISRPRISWQSSRWVESRESRCCDPHFGKFYRWNVTTILFANGQENGHAKGPYGKAHNFGNTYNFSRTCYDHFGWSWHRNRVLLVGLNSNQRQAIHQFSKYAKLLCDNQIITQAVRNCLSKTHSGAVTIKIENNPLVHLVRLK